MFVIHDILHKNRIYSFKNTSFFIYELTLTKFGILIQQLELQMILQIVFQKYQNYHQSYEQRST